MRGTFCLEILVFGLFFFLGFSGNVQGAVIVPDDFPGIQDAIHFAPAGETLIIVRPGTYFENINFFGRAITVRSDADGDPDTVDPAPEETVIHGNGQETVVTFASQETEESVLHGFTVTNGFGSSGANGNGGGGIYCEDSSPTIIGNIISNNWAGGDGGGILSRNWGHPRITSNVIYGNGAGRDGGGIACGTCHATITNSTIWGNWAVERGGAIYNWSSPVEVTNSILWLNDALVYPVIFTSTNGLTTVTYCDVQGGWAGTGNIDGDPLLINPFDGNFHISSDSPCFNGGFNGATFLPDWDLDGESRIGNETVDIGADEHFPADLHVPGEYATIQEAIDASLNGDTVIVAPGTYFENINFDGKAITLRSRDANDRSVVEGTVIDGGWVRTVVTFNHGEGLDSVLKGFTIAHGSEVWGGGIHCSGSSPTISNNIIRDNQVFSTGVHAGRGGGIYCGTSSPLIVNNLIRNNAASGNSMGGGIFCDFGSLPVITNNTIVDNSADLSGGGVSCTSSPFFANSILWGNVAPLDSQIGGGGGPVVTHCDIEGGWQGVGNIDALPLFVDAAAGDYHLKSTSPCKDTGTGLAPGLPDKDYEGDPRSAFGAVDMGADEWNLHLYHTGVVVPGGAIRIKVVGGPASPVMLFLGSGFQDPPINTQYGDFWLNWPPLWYGSIGAIPNSGVLTLHTFVPLAWTAGQEYPLQALVGPLGGPGTLFTNLMILVVE